MAREETRKTVEMWQNLPIQMKLKVAAHFDRDLAMPRQVNQPDTWRQVLMEAIPGHAGADDFDEHRYLSLLATMSKWMVRILVERMRKATQTADSQQIPHNRPHVGWQTSAVSGTIREAFWLAQRFRRDLVMVSMDVRQCFDHVDNRRVIWHYRDDSCPDGW